MEHLSFLEDGALCSDSCLDRRIFEYLFSVETLEHGDLYAARFLLQTNTSMLTVFPAVLFNSCQRNFNPNISHSMSACSPISAQQISPIGNVLTVSQRLIENCSTVSVLFSAFHREDIQTTRILSADPTPS
jgi:hypothetical protein